jgi:hypothetical protein
MIVEESLHDHCFLMHWEICDLDDEHYARQRVRVKRDTRLFEVIDTACQPVVGDLCVVERDTPIRLESVETEFKVRQNRFVGMLPVDKTKIDLIFHQSSIDGAGIAVDGRDLIHRIGCDIAKLFDHPLGRIVQVSVIEASGVGLSERTFIQRVDPGTAFVEQMGLDASAEIRSDLKVIVSRPKVSHGKLYREKRFLVMLRRLAIYLFEKFEVEAGDGLFEFAHKESKILTQLNQLSTPDDV